jgi:hypothetical protein
MIDLARIIFEENGPIIRPTRDKSPRFRPVLYASGHDIRLLPPYISVLEKIFLFLAFSA